VRDVLRAASYRLTNAIFPFLNNVRFGRTRCRFLWTFRVYERNAARRLLARGAGRISDRAAIPADERLRLIIYVLTRGRCRTNVEKLLFWLIFSREIFYDGSRTVTSFGGDGGAPFAAQSISSISSRRSWKILFANTSFVANESLKWRNCSRTENSSARYIQTKIACYTRSFRYHTTPTSAITEIIFTGKINRFRHPVHVPVCRRGRPAQFGPHSFTGVSPHTLR